MPHPRWRQDNYFHDPAHNDAPAVLATAEPSVLTSSIAPLRVWTTVARRSARLLHASARRAPQRRAGEDP
jgi:hypothetical protein